MHGLDLVNTAIFVGAALVLLGIFSSLVATRFGAPLLLVFLVVGMLAGQDGPGGIVFNDYRLTYLVGSIALSVILFDGGLRTRLSVFRGVLAPSLLLATVGVLDHRGGGGRRRPGRCSTSTRSARCCSAPSSPRPTRRRCSSCCAPAGCGCSTGSARRWRSSPAPTTRSRSSSSSC